MTASYSSRTEKLSAYSRATIHIHPVWVALESFVNGLPVDQRLDRAKDLCAVMTDLHPVMYFTPMHDGRVDHPDEIRIATGTKEDLKAHEDEKRIKRWREFK